MKTGAEEHLPVPDASVDVVISNCVLNLSPDRGRALREAWRVLRPGGALAICDVLLDAPIPASVLDRLPDGGACLEGAAHEGAYVAAIEEAGFVEVQVEREYPPAVRQSGEAGGRARMVVKIGETGEVVGSVDIDNGIDPAALPRSFNGSITARKPLDPESGERRGGR
jgi:SAM-dependent methyltransferase